MGVDGGGETRPSDLSADATAELDEANTDTDTDTDATNGTRLLILADTHIPKRAQDLAPEVWREVERADVVVHAGDWVGIEFFEQLSARASRLIAVWGNNDGPELRERMPEVARVDLGGLRVEVVHETGAAAGREHRADESHPHTDVLIFGHSHIPWDSTTPAGMRLLNPGSPTDRRRQPFRTYLTARIDAGELMSVRPHHIL